MAQRVGFSGGGAGKGLVLLLGEKKLYNLPPPHPDNLNKQQRSKGDTPPPLSPLRRRWKKVEHTSISNSTRGLINISNQVARKHEASLNPQAKPTGISATPSNSKPRHERAHTKLLLRSCILLFSRHLFSIRQRLSTHRRNLTSVRIIHLHHSTCTVDDI